MYRGVLGVLSPMADRWWGQSTRKYLIFSYKILFQALIVHSFLIGTNITQNWKNCHYMVWSYKKKKKKKNSIWESWLEKAVKIKGSQ